MNTSNQNRDCTIIESAFRRWIIVYAHNPEYAWTGSCWSRHKEGVPTGQWQICNFESFSEAEGYVSVIGLHVVREHGAAVKGGEA